MREADLQKVWKLWSEKYLKFFKFEHLKLEVAFGQTQNSAKGEYLPTPKYYESTITFDCREIASEEEAVEIFIHELLHYISQPLDELVYLLKLSKEEIRTLYAKNEQQVVLNMLFLRKLNPEIFKVPYEYYQEI